MRLKNNDTLPINNYQSKKFNETLDRKVNTTSSVSKGVNMNVNMKKVGSSLSTVNLSRLSMSKGKFSLTNRYNSNNNNMNNMTNMNSNKLLANHNNQYGSSQYQSHSSQYQ